MVITMNYKQFVGTAALAAVAASWTVNTGIPAAKYIAQTPSRLADCNTLGTLVQESEMKPFVIQAGDTWQSLLEEHSNVPRRLYERCGSLNPEYPGNILRNVGMPRVEEKNGLTRTPVVQFFPKYHVDLWHWKKPAAGTAVYLPVAETSPSTP